MADIGPQIEDDEPFADYYVPVAEAESDVGLSLAVDRHLSGSRPHRVIAISHSLAFDSDDRARYSALVVLEWIE